MVLLPLPFLNFSYYLTLKCTSRMFAGYFDAVGLDEIYGLIRTRDSVISFRILALSVLFTLVVQQKWVMQGRAWSLWSSNYLPKYLHWQLYAAIWLSIACRCHRWNLPEAFMALQSQFPTCFGNTAYFIRKLRFWSTCVLRNMNYLEWNGIYLPKRTLCFLLSLNTAIQWTQYQV